MITINKIRAKYIVLIFTVLITKPTLGQVIVDSCFTSLNPGTSFISGSDLANTTDADLLEWTSTGWIGDWSAANITIPPPTNLIGCRAIFMGNSVSWTTGGEGFGLRLSSPLVAGQTYTFYIDYVSHGTGSDGNFSPFFYTNSIPSITSAYEVGNLTPVGYTWTTNPLTFKADSAQAGHTWIIISTHPSGSSGLVSSFCKDCNNTPPVKCNVNLGKDTTLCQGETLLLNATTSDATYLWQDNSTNPTFTVTQQGKYWVRVTVNSCIASDTININYNPLFKVNLGEDTTLCKGEILVLNATTSDATYLWQDNSTNPTFTVTQQGKYWVKVSLNNCSSTDTIKINYNSPPIPNSQFVNQLKNLGDAVTYTLSPGGTAPFTYQWMNDGIAVKGATNSILNFSSIVCKDSGLYTCNVGNVCDTTIIKVVYLHVNCIRFGYTITGYVKYDNNDSTIITNTNVFLTITGDTILSSTMTDATGYYVFANVPDGKYKLSCSTTKAWGGVNPVDALIVNRTYIGMYNLTDPLKKIAADVNNDKKINPTDALMINRRYIGILNKFKINDWLFSNPSVDINGASALKNIIALCAGDVNASYVPPARVMSYDLGVKSNISINIDLNKPFDIPIYLNDNTELGALGIKFKVQSSKIKVLGVISNIEGLIYNKTDEGVNIAWSAENEGYSTTPDKPLFYITAIYDGEPNSQDSILNSQFSISSESVLADIDANLISTDKLFIPKINYQLPTINYQLLIYPNPFNNITNISYTILEEANIMLNLYNVLGEKVAVLVANDRQQAGNHILQYDGSNLRPGVYYCRIEATNSNSTYTKTDILMIAR